MMIKKLISTTAIVLFSGAMAVAQTDSSTALGGGIESWDQSTRDAFFGDDNMLRSDSEIQSGWQSLDSAQQAKLRADCLAMQSDASAAGSTGGAAGIGTDTTAGAATDSTAGAATDSTAGAATDSTAGAATDSTAGTATDSTAGTGTDTTAGTGTGTAGTGDMAQPDMASVEQLCAQIESF